MKFASRPTCMFSSSGVEKQLDHGKMSGRDRAAERPPTEGRASKISHNDDRSRPKPHRGESVLHCCSHLAPLFRS